MARRERSLSLELRDVQVAPNSPGVAHVQLKTNKGVINCLYHEAGDSTAAVIWVGGAGGGLFGPAGGLYPRLANLLVGDRIASLRLDYRFPNHLEKCVLDVLAGVAFLEPRGHKRIALVGHSFGGAVVITAGSLSPAVVGVAALSSQTFGTDAAADLGGRHLLLMHGRADNVLPDYCSQDIYDRATGEKNILLYPGCGHGLDECRDQVDQDLSAWLRGALR